MSGFDAALVLHAWRLVRRGAVVVLVVAAGMSAVVVWQYRSLAADGFDPGAMRALAESPAIRIMFGKPVALGDPGGFTVWRTGTPMAVLVAVWSALTAVRITRGEEEAGRWNLLLAGRVRLARLLGLQLAVIMAAAVAIGVAVAVAMIVAGTATSGAVLYGTALALIGAGAAAWGGLAGQLVGERRRASVLATAGIGAGLLARMVADSADGLSGLHWLTPFGLLGLIEPFAANRPGPLAVLLLAGLALAAAVRLCSSRRDVGAGVLPARTSHRARLGGLRSLPGFAVRRSTGSVVAWATGIWLYFLVIGLLASSLTVFLADNPLFADLAARAGFGSLTTVAGYLASLFALLAVPLGLFAAGRVAAGDADEEARRLTVVFAAPVTRRRWFLVEAGAAVAGTVVLAAGAGLAAWAGAAAVGADIAPGRGARRCAERAAGGLAQPRCGTAGVRMATPGHLAGRCRPRRRRLPAAGAGRKSALARLGAESLPVPAPAGRAVRERELDRRRRDDLIAVAARRDRSARLPPTRPPRLTPG